jgi:glycerophosphoryl diester phosphodiesterase
MTPTRRDVAAFAFSAPLAWAIGRPARAVVRDPLVVATGAGAAEIPESTAGAFELAIRDGADFIAADFTPTRDGALVALPDHELSALTDVAARPEFASRKQTHTIDGEDRAGWFAEDFTLSELKTLVRAAPAAKGRGAKVPARAILTFEEVVAIARAGSVRAARVVGVSAGIGHAPYFASIDLAIEPLLAAAIRVAGYDSAAAAMFVRSGDAASLKAIGDLTRARRVVRMGPKDDASPDALKAIRGYAEAAAPVADVLLDLSNPKSVKPTAIVADAHAAGLGIHAWTLGGAFPSPPFKAGDTGRLLADLYAADVDAVAGAPAAAIARARADAVAHARR